MYSSPATQLKKTNNSIHRRASYLSEHNKKGTLVVSEDG
jgi:hypothetical protein